MYDFLIVGAGLFGATAARALTDQGYKCLVIDKNSYIGGNCSDEYINNTLVCKHGPHIFNTSNKKVWDFINQFVQFNNYIHKVFAIHESRMYSLPINMMTIHQLCGAITVREAKIFIDARIKEYEEINTVEEYAMSTVGLDIYNILIKGYSEKQWGMPCNKLPAEILKRIPIRMNWNNNYYNSTYQGMPIGGYTLMFQNLLAGIDVRLNTPFSEVREWTKLSKSLIYTGKIDEFFEYKYGMLPYRSLMFKTKIEENTYNHAQINFTENKVPYTRISEHQYYYPEYLTTTTPVVTYEYPAKHDNTNTPYYPIETRENCELYQKYKNELDSLENTYFGGRLGQYRYFNMDKTIEETLKLVKKIRRN